MKQKTYAKQRSMKRMRKQGWTVADVEKWIPPRGDMEYGVRQDVWNFGDILACRVIPGVGREIGQTALVQTFPLARWNDHVEKIREIPEARIWKDAGNLIFLHGWGLKPKGGVRGARKVWTLREETL